MGVRCVPSANFVSLSDSEWIFYITYRPQLEEKVPLIIMFHGFTGHHIEAGRLYTDLAMHLCNEGIATLRFDYRGHGDSSGFFDEAFSPKNAISDAEMIINQVIKTEDPSKRDIIFLGFSLGGYIALKMFEKFSEIAKALILFAPAIVVPEIPHNWEMRGDDYVYLPLTFGPFRIKTDTAKEMTHNIMHLAEKINIPTLIIHAKDDQSLNYMTSVEFFNRIKFEDKNIILLDKGGHTFSDYEIRQKIYNEVVQWLKKKLT